MVCVPCFIVPFLLFLWRFLQPFVLKFWNPFKEVKADESKNCPKDALLSCPCKPSSAPESSPDQQVVEGDKKEK